jgi:hypothetical protein
MQLAELMGHLWDTTEQQPILAKYKIALTLAKIPPFPKGEEPYQSAFALVRLRNALVQLLAKQFAPNPLADQNKPFFPHWCLGYGCAPWSVETALTLYYRFLKRLDLSSQQIPDQANLAVK